MKNITLLFILFLAAITSLNAQNQKLDQLFDKYQNTDGITSIKIAKPMFGMLSNLNIADSELAHIKPLLTKIQGLKMLIIQSPETSPNNKNTPNYTTLTKEVLGSVNALNYQELMSVNQQDSRIKFLTNDVKNGIMDNLLLDINSGDSTVLMFLDGKISMDDINTMVNENSGFGSATTTPGSKSETPPADHQNYDANRSTEIRKVGSFRGLETSAGINVVFTQNKNQLVKVETDPGMLRYIKTEVSGDILRISINNNGVRNLRFRKILVSVDAPTLESLKVTSGASFTTANRVKTNHITINVTSGASVKAEVKAENELKYSASSGASAKIDLEASRLQFDSSSGSSTTLTGRVGQADYEASSASSCNAQNLTAKNVNARASSGATLKINAMESLETQVSSGAIVRYTGNPAKVNAKNSSGGSTKKID